MLVALPHTLNIDFASDGIGSGSVFFVQKSQTYNSNYSTTVYSFDSITLQETPVEYSVFGGWSGICTNTTGNCQYSVPTVASGGNSQTATATFNFDGAHAVYVYPYYYSTILGAYNAATTVNGAEIRIFGTSFSENLILGNGKTVTLTGGDNQAHTDNSSGMTTVQGMTVQSGQVTVDRITIQ